MLFVKQSKSICYMTYNLYWCTTLTKFWRTISPASAPNHISLRNDTGTPITQEVCLRVFNDFFSEMFTKEDYSSIPPVSDVDYPFMSPIDITIEGGTSLIKILKVSTSSGIDAINTKILQHTLPFSSITMYHIFKQSLASSEIPFDWKIGTVVPIFKSGDKSKVENYRPISLTCIASKLLEHILASEIAQHLEEI